MAYQFGNNTLLGLAFEVALIEILGTTGDLKIELVHYDQKKKKLQEKNVTFTLEIEYYFSELQIPLEK